MAATFFAKLPHGRLNPIEAELKDLLVRTAVVAKRLLPPRGVSLQDWVERRMPGEVALGTDASGRVTLLPQAPRAAEPAPALHHPEKPAGIAMPTPKASPLGKAQDAQAFFAGLPQDSFTPAEEKLRAAVTAWLATAKGPMAAANAQREPQIGAAARALLPAGVPLAEWVERRIGGEVLVTDGERGREMRLAPGGKEERREAFFASLPADSFGPEEERLRSAIFDFLATWKSKELANLSHVGSDKGVQHARGRFLPPGVALRDWVERRIGGELELKVDAKGQYVVHLTPAARPLVSQRFAQLGGEGRGPRDPPREGPREGPRGREERAPREAPEPPPAQQENSLEFFSSLPADELLPAELELREAIVGFLEAWPEQHGEQVPVLAAAGQDKEIQRRRASLLPQGVSLHAWIERRIGGEVETRPHTNGQIALVLVGGRRRQRGVGKGRREAAGPGGGAAGKGAGAAAGRGEEPPAEREEQRALANERREAFFAELPPDGFTPDESRMREALLAFLAEWKGPESPSLSHAGGDARVRDARSAFLPKGCGVSLKEWIDRRIGGEIETSAPEGKGMEVQIGLRGQLQLDPAGAARPMRKRKADGGKGHDGKGGAGGKSGKATNGIIGMDPAQGPPWKKGR